MLLDFSILAKDPFLPADINMPELEFEAVDPVFEVGGGAPREQLTRAISNAKRVLDECNGYYQKLMKLRHVEYCQLQGYKQFILNLHEHMQQAQARLARLHASGNRLESALVTPFLPKTEQFSIDQSARKCPLKDTSMRCSCSRNASWVLI